MPLKSQPKANTPVCLQWPQWKKEVILCIIGLSAAVVGAYGPMLSPGFVQISAELGIDVNTLSQATGWLILTIGLCLFIANPLAKIYGKRPVYIVAILIMFIGSVWGGASKDYSSFLGSRIFSGFGMAPYEVLVQCTIGDLYFVHERATRLAIWNLFLLTGIAGGALISGYVIQDLDFRWTFWLCAILFGLCVLSVIFYVPETTFRRRKPHTIAHTNEKHSSTEAIDPEKEPSSTDLESSPSPTSTPRKMSYARSLRFYSGRYTSSPFWKIFLRPLIVFWYPAVLWAFLIYGTTLTWIVVFSVVNASVFTAPPYNFSVSQTGLISLSPFILTIIGELVSVPLNDWI